LTQNLSEEVGKQELISLVGPNGTGKSTLLRTVAGMQHPLAGDVKLLGKSVTTLSARQLAKFVSVVLTDNVTVGYIRAREIVAMGRFPHTGWLGSFLPSDRRKVEHAIQQAGIDHLLNKSLYQLSDGERQKVMIARALAQDTPLMLLDEPTTHLDVANRVSIIELLRKLVQSQGKSILFSTHDIELALQVSDRIWLLHDRKITNSTPEDLVLSGLLNEVMGSELAPFDPQSGTFKITPITDRYISLKGSGVTALWTQRALERVGYQIKSLASIAVEVVSAQEWQLKQDEQIIATVGTIDDLLQQLSQLTKDPSTTKRLT
jgi:iron complex transport system ATP-binding protein